MYEYSAVFKRQPGMNAKINRENKEKSTDDKNVSVNLHKRTLIKRSYLAFENIDFITVIW